MNKSRSIKARILTTSLLMVVFLISVGVTGILALNMVTAKYDHVARINFPNAQILQEMEHRVLEISRSYLRVAIPGVTPEEVKKRLEVMEESIAAYEKSDATYRTVPFVAGEQQRYDATDAAWKKYLAEVRASTELLKSGKAEDMELYRQKVGGVLTDLRTNFGKEMTELQDFQDDQAKTWVDAAETNAAFFKLLLMIAVAIGTAVALVLGFLSSTSLSKSLREISKQINESGSQVRTASEQLSNASLQLSAGATQAASALEETVASVEELTSMVKLNSDNAREASALSQSSRQSAEEGEAEIRKLNEAVNDIAQSSKKIEEIINVIDDIAFQTNLLALNAAVEAARAGEQGKGFAVVAEAVRTLAQRSASAAKDITSLIKESVAKIDRGAKIADEGGKVLKNIVVSVKKVADLNNEIATASQEQSNGLIQISKAMTELDQATQRNASSSEETASSAQEMSSQAICLEGLVSELNVVVEGSAAAKSETIVRNRNVPVVEHKTQKGLATVTPIHTRQQDARAVIPLNADEENRFRKVGNIEGF